jgi:uncharacterized membrane protein YbhN (UPF0104 family)
MKKKIITAVKYLWILAVVVFVSLYFYTHFESIVKIVDHIPFFNLLCAFITLFLAKVLLSYTALLSVNYVSINIPFSKMFSIYNITQLAKYIPGSIWQFVGKAGAYAKEGMSASTIKKSIFITEFFFECKNDFYTYPCMVFIGHEFFYYVDTLCRKYEHNTLY